jgi:cell wall-associated NlpC family hydrolase
VKITYDHALSFLGLPYISGGNSAIVGFDCSGLVCEILRPSGLIKHKEDLTAQGLWDKFERSGPHGAFAIGALAFYGESVTKITHVAWCLDQYRMIEAGGGDHTTKTLADAIARNACVRIRPIKFRSDFIGTIKPSYSGIGMI